MSEVETQQQLNRGFKLASDRFTFLRCTRLRTQNLNQEIKNLTSLTT
ncbi:hypothetical protein CKA32_003557 [Geitlerinema sp. FC II]|nr:hypothetical protein CKA32_003557 [Geitlerinema sp. FC II]